MTDRELLEAAAKAAGIKGRYETRNQCENGDWIDRTAIFLRNDMGWWNPLIDDGDALRLMSKLKIAVGFLASGKPSRSVYADIDEGEVGAYQRGHSPAALRRAIVRCAAAKHLTPSTEPL